jgi:hypothetical protein
VNRLKQFRHIATRYEKTARAFVSTHRYTVKNALRESIP